MKQFRRFICSLILSVMTSAMALAQGNNVTGVVFDDKGDPVIGASVVQKGNTKNATITDIDGNFSLSLPSGKGTIMVSYIGMNTKELSVTAGKSVKVTLETDDKQLEEVVVVGYGQQKKA